MKAERGASHLSPSPEHVFTSRRAAIIAVLLITSLISTSCTTGYPAQQTSSGGIPGRGVVIGVGIAATAFVGLSIYAVVEDHKKHTLQGCIVTGPNGPELHTDSKTILLDGDIADLKMGDRLKVHGSHAKKTKDKSGPDIFHVVKVTKNYGPCPANLAMSASPAH